LIDRQEESKRERLRKRQRRRKNKRESKQSKKKESKQEHHACASRVGHVMQRRIPAASHAFCVHPASC